jgi:hypothetical protein
MTIWYAVSLSLHLFLAVIMIEVALRYLHWFEQTRINDGGETFRYAILGVAAIATSLIAWVVTVIDIGFARRLIPSYLGSAIDIGLLIGFLLCLIPIWIIEMQMTGKRVTYCIAWRAALAAVGAAALLHNGL